MKPFMELEAETQIGDFLSDQEASVLHYFAIVVFIWTLSFS